MPVKVKVDSDTCVGCGLCVGSFPDTFEFDENGKAKVHGDIDEGGADEAIGNCPAGAISK
ncbi:MAG: ferredoxin [Bacilli bacterium]|jgi:ferredoxin